jgi:hypothetical protein
MDRFNASDLGELITEIARLSDSGAHLVFCWGERIATFLQRGGWAEIGRDHVWLSEGLLPGRTASN